MPEDKESTAASDNLFRRAVVVSTALCLGVTYSWLAGFVREPTGDLSFHWRWMIVPWALIGLLSAVYFWHKIWPPENRPDAKRRDVVEGCLALLLPGVWWLVLPLRSLSGQHFWQVLEGLVAAALVLSFGAFMIIRLGRGFENDDEADPEKYHPANVAKEEDQQK